MEENKTKVPQKYENYWNIIEKDLNNGSQYGYKVAIIDTEKILRLALKEKNIPGETYDEKVEFVKKIIANPEKLGYSRAMCKKIKNEIGFDISLEDTKEIIAGYYKAISDISEMNYYSVSTKDRILLLAEKYSKQVPQLTKNVLAVLLLFFLIIFVSSETEAGKKFSSDLAEISKIIFYKIVPAILITIVVVIGLLIVVGYIKKRRKH